MSSPGRKRQLDNSQSLPGRSGVGVTPSKGRVGAPVTAIHRYSKPGTKMNTLSGYHGRKGSLYSKPRNLKTDGNNSKQDQIDGNVKGSWFGVFTDKKAERLKQVELAVLQRFVSTSCWSQFIGVSNEVEIRTLKFDLGFFRSTPALVLLHGFASGLACWAPCFDALSARCVVYALDLPGFGRSTRPSFDGDDTTAIEYQFVSYLEEWRDTVGLDSFIVAGHGFGGYIACLYAMKHPERVRHVVLIEPWGFNELPLGVAEKNRGKQQNGKAQAANGDSYFNKLPFWLKQVNNVFNFSDALALFRTLPSFLSEWLYAKMFMRPLPCSEDERPVNVNDYFWSWPESHNYVYQCNKMKGTGESAFAKLNVLYFWAKNPLICRLGDLDPEVPLSFIYGSSSAVDHKTGYEAYHLRPESFVEVYMVERAGHNVFIDNPRGFTDVVISIVDEIEMEISEIENGSSIRSRLYSAADELYWDCEWETLDLGPEQSEGLPDIIVEDYSNIDFNKYDEDGQLYDPDQCEAVGLEEYEVEAEEEYSPLLLENDHREPLSSSSMVNISLPITTEQLAIDSAA